MRLGFSTRNLHAAILADRLTVLRQVGRVLSYLRSRASACVHECALSWPSCIAFVPNLVIVYGCSKDPEE